MLIGNNMINLTKSIDYGILTTITVLTLELRINTNTLTLGDLILINCACFKRDLILV